MEYICTLGVSGLLSGGERGKGVTFTAPALWTASRNKRSSRRSHDCDASYMLIHNIYKRKCIHVRPGHRTACRKRGKRAANQRPGRGRVLTISSYARRAIRLDGPMKNMVNWDPSGIAASRQLSIRTLQLLETGPSIRNCALVGRKARSLDVLSSIDTEPRLRPPDSRGCKWPVLPRPLSTAERYCGERRMDGNGAETSEHLLTISESAWKIV